MTKTSVFLNNLFTSQILDLMKPLIMHIIWQVPLAAAKYYIREKNPHSKKGFMRSLPLGYRVSGLARHGKQPHCNRALPRISNEVTNQNAKMLN